MVEWSAKRDGRDITSWKRRMEEWYRPTSIIASPSEGSMDKGLCRFEHFIDRIVPLCSIGSL